MSSSSLENVGSGQASQLFCSQREVRLMDTSGLWSHSVTTAFKASANEMKACFYTILNQGAFWNLL